jgi:hypothetical protein
MSIQMLTVGQSLEFLYHVSIHTPQPLLNVVVLAWSCSQPGSSQDFIQKPFFTKMFSTIYNHSRPVTNTFNVVLLISSFLYALADFGLFASVPGQPCLDSQLPRTLDFIIVAHGQYNQLGGEYFTSVWTNLHSIPYFILFKCSVILQVYKEFDVHWKIKVRVNEYELMLQFKKKLLPRKNLRTLNSARRNLAGNSGPTRLPSRTESTLNHGDSSALSNSKALFRLQVFLIRTPVALSFVFGKYCPIMD